MRFTLKKTKSYRIEDNSSDSINYFATVSSMDLDRLRFEDNPNHIKEGKVHAKNLLIFADKIAEFPWKIGELEFVVEKEEKHSPSEEDPSLFVVTNQWYERETSEIYSTAISCKKRKDKQKK